MPNSNERSVQIVGSEKQITECVQYFLEEISKVRGREGGRIRGGRGGEKGRGEGRGGGRIRGRRGGREGKG